MSRFFLTNPHFVAIRPASSNLLFLAKDMISGKGIVMYSFPGEEEKLTYPLVSHKKGRNSEEYAIPDSDKEAVLKKMYPFEDIPTLDEQLFDLHQGRLFVVKDFRVVREDGKNYLVSPYYYESGGTVIDWMPASWADESETS
jgi:hypothetical protein